MRTHRLLVFRHQMSITPERHLQIGRWFGQIESTFYDHPASPHRDVFRVSNDRSEGCTGGCQEYGFKVKFLLLERNIFLGVGRTGWHIDGSFQEAPFSHSIYHIIETPSRYIFFIFNLCICILLNFFSPLHTSFFFFFCTAKSKFLQK